MPTSTSATTSTMRAAAVDQFGPPEGLRVTERPIPEPGEDEISIDVDYAGVCFVDTLLRSGAFPMATPLTPGIEVTGHVRATGPGVDGFAPGRSVAALLNDFGRGDRAGGYAEVAVAHRTMAVPLPDGVDLPAVTAVIINGVTAWMALHDVARLEARDRVLVLGASGGLGATTARMAALHPAARVIGVVGHDPSRAPRECTDAIVADELGEQLDRISPDGMVDVVIDPVGGSLRAAAYSRLAPFGRHIVLGDASGDDQPFSGDEAWLQTRVTAGLSVGGIARGRPDDRRVARPRRQPNAWRDRHRAAAAPRRAGASQLDHRRGGDPRMGARVVSGVGRPGERGGPDARAIRRDRHHSRARHPRGPGPPGPAGAG